MAKKIFSFVLLILTFFSSFSYAYKEICQDIESLNQWPIQVRFAMLEGGQKQVEELVNPKSATYNKILSSLSRFIGYTKIMNEVDRNQVVAKKIAECIQSLKKQPGEKKYRTLPKIDGDPILSPIDNLIFSKEILSQIEKNSSLKSSLEQQLGKEQFDIFIEFLKTTAFKDSLSNRVKDSLYYISLGTIILALLIFAISGALGSTIFIPIYYVVGGVLALALNYAHSEIIDLNTKFAVKSIPDSKKYELYLESYVEASKIIQDTIKIIVEEKQKNNSNGSLN